MQGMVVDDHHPYHRRVHGMKATRRPHESLAENTHWQCVERSLAPPQ